MDILLGIGGAVVGGWLFHIFGMSGVTGVNVYRMLVATVGAVVFLVVYVIVLRDALVHHKPLVVERGKSPNQSDDLEKSLLRDFPPLAALPDARARSKALKVHVSTAWKAPAEVQSRFSPKARWQSDASAQ